MSNMIVADDTNFEAIVASADKRLVLVDFWAPWCAPCRSLAPVLDELAEEFGDDATFVKLDITANEASAKKVNVQGIPLIVIYREGAELTRHVGALSKTRLAALIEGAL